MNSNFPEDLPSKAPEDSSPRDSRVLPVGEKISWVILEVLGVFLLFFLPYIIFFFTADWK